MTFHRLLLVALLSVFIALAGCRASTAPQTIARYNPQLPPQAISAPYRGQYSLFAMTGYITEPPPGAQPIVTRHLSAGDRVGFSRAENGQLLAVAGSDVFTIPPQHHLWQMRADPGQIDKSKNTTVVTTTILIVAIVAVGVGIALVSFR